MNPISFFYLEHKISFKDIITFVNGIPRALHARIRGKFSSKSLLYDKATSLKSEKFNEKHMSNLTQFLPYVPCFRIVNPMNSLIKKK